MARQTYTGRAAASDVDEAVNFIGLRIGTAGWNVPKQHAEHFAVAPPDAHTTKLSHLQRSSSRLACVEINSSFHRPHQRKTYARWAADTPDNFRFAVKLPKAITHTAKLLNTGAPLQAFTEQCLGLNDGPVPKLGPLLVQLPPKLALDEGVVHEFFTTLRELLPFYADEPQRNLLALEPRHTTWFTPAADRLLREFQVARVAADPPKGSPLAAVPGGWAALRYWRLHGTPRTYYSEYGETTLTKFAETLHAEHRTLPNASQWVIFDNTAMGHAHADALTLQRLCARP